MIEDLIKRLSASLCPNKLDQDIAEMLRSQNAEIERLKSRNDHYIILANTAYEIVDELRIEIAAIKAQTLLTRTEIWITGAYLKILRKIQKLRNSL